MMKPSTAYQSISDRAAEKAVRAALASLTLPQVSVIAVSGGVDSLALADALVRYCPQQRFVIAHVNHQLRATSAADADHVAAFARQHDLAYHQSDWQPVTHNIESAAREYRYAFFRQVCQQYGTDSVMTAHHADDQAETFLFKLLRGNRLTRSLAMAPVTQLWENLRVWRPFLGITKAHIMRYAQARQLQWCHDVTNDDPDYTARNRLRQTVLPALAELNAQAVRHLATAAVTITEQQALIDSQADTYCQALDAREERWQSLPSHWLPTVVVRWLQHRAIYAIKPAQLRAIVALIQAPDQPNGQVVLNKNTLLQRCYDDVSLITDTAVNSHEVRQSVMLKLNAWTVFEKQTVCWSSAPPSAGQAGHYFSDLPALAAVTLRGPQSGDRLALASGRKRLRRLFIDAKVPRTDRAQAWVLTDDQQVLACRLQSAKWQTTARPPITTTAKQGAWLLWQS